MNVKTYKPKKYWTVNVVHLGKFNFTSKRRMENYVQSLKDCNFILSVTERETKPKTLRSK